MTNNNFQKPVTVTADGAKKLYDAVFRMVSCRDFRSEMCVSGYPDDLQETVEFLLSLPDFETCDTLIYFYRYECFRTQKEAAMCMHMPDEIEQELEREFLRKMRLKNRLRLLMLGIKKVQLLVEESDAEQQYKDACLTLEDLKATIENYRKATEEIIALRQQLARTEHNDEKQKLLQQLDEIVEYSLQMIKGDLYTLTDADVLLKDAFPAMSARSLNALATSGIDTIGKLKSAEYYSIRRIRNLGKGSLMEIMKSLKEYDGSILEGTPDKVAMNL